MALRVDVNKLAFWFGFHLSIIILAWRGVPPTNFTMPQRNAKKSRNKKQKKSNPQIDRNQHNRQVVSKPQIQRLSNARRLLKPKNEAEKQYIRSLFNPWEVRGVRCPTPFPAATQVSTYHGTLTFSTNSLGFARVYMRLATSQVGSIDVYNGATHTETVLGSATALYAGPGLTISLGRLVNAGLKCRSSASFSNEAGFIQAYVSQSNPDNASYDVYRDHPHQKLYQKGETARVVAIPFDRNNLSLYSVPNWHYSGYHMGFMISGAPSLTYVLQYAITLEYISTFNTDLLPHVLSPIGDASDHLADVKSVNPCADDATASYMSDVLTKGVNAAASVANAAGQIIGSGIEGLINPRIKNGYSAQYRSIKAGNAALFDLDR